MLKWNSLRLQILTQENMEVTLKIMKIIMTFGGKIWESPGIWSVRWSGTPDGETNFNSTSYIESGLLYHWESIKNREFGCLFSQAGKTPETSQNPEKQKSFQNWGICNLLGDILAMEWCCWNITYSLSKIVSF